MKRYNPIVVRITGWLIWLLTYLIAFTVRCTFIGRDTLEHVLSKTAIVGVFWHGEFFILPYLNRKKKVVLIVSQSADGDISAATMRHYGFAAIRGSSTRGAEAATLGVIDYIKNNYTVAITGDGPKGPYHELKPGPVWFAQKMDIPLIPVTIRFKHYVRLKSWDKFFIPIPFTRAVVIYGEPVSMQGLQRREGIRIVKQHMEQQESMAENML